MSSAEPWPDEDQVHYPQAPQLAYWVSYPLFAVTIGVLALGFVTTGALLNVVERLVEELRRILS